MPRVFSTCLLAAILAASPGLHAEGDGSGKQPASRLTTGTRDWKLADGDTKRMRLLQFDRGTGSPTFRTKARPFSVPLAKFSKEDRDFLLAMRQGTIGLVRTPGLNLDSHFKTGRRIADSAYQRHWVGVRRTWTATSGRTIEGVLINLTDDDVSVVVKDTVYRLPLENLSDADLEYLESVQRGGAPLYPETIVLTAGANWDGSLIDYRVTVSGERCAALPGPEGRFEVALAAALTEVNDKYPHPDWELMRFEEQPQDSSDTNPPPWLLAAPPRPAGPIPSVYAALFKVPEKRRSEIERHWPLTISPREFGVQFYVFILTDGALAHVEKSE